MILFEDSIPSLRDRKQLVCKLAVDVDVFIRTPLGSEVMQDGDVIITLLYNVIA